ncbi:hypothetical protein [Chitinophaga terrae (ex Kim and Jung 2007)]|nr:hypothetical protein [Chitinophaga terrae (ex Kim and Jung 2007)]
MQNRYIPGIRTLLTWLLFSLTMTGSGQASGNTYWKLSNLKRVDGKAMYGATLSMMEHAAERNPYFIKEGDRLTFSYPQKKSITLAEFITMTGEKAGPGAAAAGFNNTYLDSITGIEVSESKLVVHFEYFGTLDNDKRFVAEYKLITPEQYAKRVEADIQEEKVREGAKQRFLETYKQRAAWKQPSTTGALKEIVLQGSLGSITLLAPKGYDVRESGDFEVHRFGPFDAGTFSHNNVFKLYQEPSTNTEATCFVVPAEGRTFNLQEYINSKERYIVEQEGNGFYAIEPEYDEDTKEVSIENHIFFRYFVKGDRVIFVMAETDEEPKASELYRFMQQLRLK